MPWPYPYQKMQDPLVFPPGILRTEIVIQQPNTTRDAFNAPSSTGWVAMYVTLAAVFTTSSKELFLANQFDGQVSHLVTFRWPGEIGIAASMRVYLPQSGQTFIIQAPPENVQQRNRRVNLLCLELAEPGAAT